MQRFDLNTQVIGRVWEHFNIIDSTNTYLKSIAERSEVLSGHTITAAYQVAGRGQMSNQWKSNAAENILMSILLKDINFPTDLLFLLNMQISNILHSYLDKILTDTFVFSTPLKIKWPNDIYFGNSKIAGILIENALSGNMVTQSVIGIGLNVNQEIIEKGATSISQIAKNTFDIPKISAELLIQFDADLMPLVDSKGLNHSFNEQVKQNYFANLLNFNKEANYLDNLNNHFTGKIINVDTGGRLIMDVANHKKVFNIKEVKFLF